MGASAALLEPLANAPEPHGAWLVDGFYLGFTYSNQPPVPFTVRPGLAGFTYIWTLYLVLR